MIPIASRTLRIVEGDTERHVVVQLFMPELDEEHGAWKCAYEIGWPDKPRTFRAFGLDGVQAIELAMRMIGAELYTSEHHTAGTLMQFVKGGGYGFPVSPTLRDLLEGDDVSSFG